MSAELKAFWEALAHLSGREVVDILLVASLIYGVLKLIRDTRAMPVVYGVIAFVLLYAVAVWAGLHTLEFVLRHAMLYVGIAVIVIFQSELRAALMQFRRYLPHPFGGRRLRAREYEQLFEEVILAATTLAAERIGALIVFERDVSLESVVETGVRLDAHVSYDLLVSIFNPRAPLHDGAVIIRGDRIVAASCFLPLTLNPQLSKELGTRHRAAIGITEDTDAVALVVSEETGIISFVSEGRISRHLDATRLRHFLRTALHGPRRLRAAETNV